MSFRMSSVRMIFCCGWVFGCFVRMNCLRMSFRMRFWKPLNRVMLVLIPMLLLWIRLVANWLVNWSMVCPQLYPCVALAFKLGSMVPTFASLLMPAVATFNSLCLICMLCWKAWSMHFCNVHASCPNTVVISRKQVRSKVIFFMVRTIWYKHKKTPSWMKRLFVWAYLKGGKR